MKTYYIIWAVNDRGHKSRLKVDGDQVQIILALDMDDITLAIIDGHVRDLRCTDTGWIYRGRPRKIKIAGIEKLACNWSVKRFLSDYDSAVCAGRIDVDIDISA